MKARIVLLFLLPALSCAPGCSLIARNTVVKGEIASLRKAPRIDPNDPNCSISSIDIVNTAHGQRVDVKIREDSFAIDMGARPYRVKYQKRPGPKRRLDNSIILDGELVGSAQQYPINIDTGSPGYILVNDIHILENKLPVYHNPDDLDGICCLPDLRIGELILRNLTAKYYFKHSELQLFRLAIDKSNEITIGLSLLQMFKYVAFDNVNREVEFSTTQNFPVQDQGRWSRYPFSIEADAQGNPRLLLEMPVGGQTMNLIFDTGCEAALLTSENTWKQAQKRLTKVKRSFKTVYFPYAGGKVRSKTVIVKELELGHKTVKSAYVCILPNDASIIETMGRQQGLLGMQCFADTTVVLDFERDVLWVKNNLTTGN